MSINVKNLTYTYHPGTPLETKALCGVSFSVETGEWLAVVGHTGSGKSTLVQHLNALLLPQQGSIEVDGINLSPGEKRLREVRRKVGFVFQYPEQQLFAETVEEEVAFAPRNWGFPEGKISGMVRSALAAVGLSADLLSSSPFALSGGQKRRVALASVLAAEPTYLVLDEPTAGLDGRGRHELLKLLQKFVDSGRSIVHVTHDLDIAFARTSRILVLEKGEMRACGSPAEVLQLLLERPVPGLCLPPILELCALLRERGWQIPLSENVEELYRAIVSERTRHVGKKEEVTCVS